MDRILTTHVGSLVRAPAVTEALRLALHGEAYDRKAFSNQLAEAVADVVGLQAEIGLDVVNDGEMSKSNWISYFYGRLDGIEARVVPLVDRALPEALESEGYQPTDIHTNYVRWDGDDTERGTTWACTGPIAYVGSDLERDIENLTTALAGHEVVDGFMPAVAPGSIYWIENEYYATEDEMMWAFADALHEEYKRIVDAGLVLSVDDAVLWHKFTTIRLHHGTGADYRRWAEPRVEALNHALRGIPQDRVRYHVCSGSNHGPHVHDVPLREIIDLVLKVNAHAYQIEQGNAAHEHEWRIWEDIALPDDKIVVPGLVTHHTMMVEHPELVAQRITRLAKLIGRERVMAGTDCGFSQLASRQRVPVWTQWAKLRSLVEGARIASTALWSAQRIA